MLGGCVSVAEPGRGWAREARRGARGRRLGRAHRPAATPPRAPPPPALRAPAGWSDGRRRLLLFLFLGASSSGGGRRPGWRGCAAGRAPPGTPGLGLAARELYARAGGAPRSPGRGREGAAHTLAGASHSSRAPAAPSCPGPAAHPPASLGGCRSAEREGPRPRGPRGQGDGESPGRPTGMRSGGFAGFPGPFCSRLLGSPPARPTRP